MPGEPLIEATALMKRFGAFRAVDEVDFTGSPTRWDLKTPR